MTAFIAQNFVPLLFCGLVFFLLTGIPVAFGLVATILGCLKARPEAVPYAVGLFITAGYWFTASTSFANPAVTIARSLTDTFSGIRPVDAPGFIVAQLLGAAAATLVFRWLLAPEDSSESGCSS